MPDDRKTLLLIDTFGLIYRMFYTLPPNMKAPDGTPTNAAFGLARVLMKICTEMKPDYFVAAMESRGPTFRHEEFPDYKAHRDKMPEELRAQIPIVKEIISAMGLAPVAVEGYEADDVIGTLCRTGTKEGLEVKVITGDKDLLQLVDDNVRILMSQKGITELAEYDREKVKETMGVYPERVADKKGLEGDSSDNIPGVKGVGKKTADKLLEQFDTLENLYESLDKVDSKSVRSKLEDNRDMAALSKRLATIVTDVPIARKLNDFRFNGLDAAAAGELFARYAFTTLIKELGPEAEKAAEAPPVAEQLGSKYKLVSDEKELKDFLDAAKQAGRLCIDLETMGLDPFNDPIVGYSLAHKAGDAIYVPVRHEAAGGAKKEFTGDLFGGGDEAPEEEADPGGFAEGQLPPERALEIIKPYIEDPELKLLGHNLKFDMLMLMNAGAKFANVYCDTFIAAYLVDPSTRGYGLKPVSSRLLDIRMKSYEDVAGRGKDQIPFSQVNMETAVDYACADVDTVLRIEPLLTKELEDRNVTEVFRRIEMPLVPVLAEMEAAGIALNKSYLGELSEKLTRREQEIEEKIREIAGEEVNPRSPKQVSELLFDRLGLQKIQKRSTDVSVLEKLKDEHEVVPLIIDHRQISKLRGTYVDALPQAVNKTTGRIHTSFNQTLTATGRLSSSDPNLQNIPIRTPEGREIRRAFVPGEKSQVFVAADYSQVEVRILAHMCADPTLIQAFENREDIHRRTAAEVFGLEQADVTTDQRRYAKTINFGIIYGKTDYGLSQELEIPVHEAATFIRKYFDRYPKIREFIDSTHEEAQRDGYVTTLFGRRRYIPEAQSENAMQRQAGFRAAVNTRIQGTAADVIKLAMIKIHRMILSGELDARMLLQVHDELVFEVNEAKMESEAAKIKKAMETATAGWIDLDVVLETDVKAGPNWLDMDPVKL